MLYSVALHSIIFLMGQNDVERYNLLPPREFYSAMPVFFCISLVIQETNYKRLVVVVYFRERVFLSSTTSAWSPWIFMSSTLFTLCVFRRLNKIIFLCFNSLTSRLGLGQLIR